MVRQQAVKLEVEGCGIGKVRNANGAAANLVFVSRADAATRGADLRASGGFFARGVDVLVPGQDEAGIVGKDEVARPEADAGLRDRLDLVEQVPWVHHHA